MQPTERDPELVEMLSMSSQPLESKDDVKFSPVARVRSQSPDEPKHNPKKLRRFDYLALSGHIFLIIFPILFIALGSTAIALHEKKLSSTGTLAQRAINVSPTVFPIIFAGIIGHFFRALGLYWAERGIKIGVLERLIGSQSLFSTLEKQILLQDQYALGVAMILVWALSPLGGQAALRLLSVVPKTATSDATIRYLPIAAARDSAMAGASTLTSLWPLFASLFMTGLTTSRLQQNATQDLFGNVRIPTLGADAKEGVWNAIDHSQPISYSSMLGVPVVGIPQAGNTSFNLISRYFAIDCSQSSIVQNTTVFRNTSEGEGAGYAIYTKGANFVVELTVPSDIGLFTDNTLEFNMTSMNSDDLSECSFLKCSMKARDVESSVSCISHDCKVESTRSIAVDPNSWLVLTAIRNAFSFLPLVTVGAISHGSRFSSSLIEKWLENPYTNLYGQDTYSFANLTQVPLTTLSRNFEVMFNTYWQSTYGEQYIYGNLSTDMSLYNNITNATYGSPTDFNTTQTTIDRDIGEQYKCNMAFAAILIVISCLLLLAGLASIWLMSSTLAPDILGYMSSYTRDNPFIATNNEHASHLDGIERSRAMRNVEVTLGDVHAGRDAGYIALAASEEVKPLQRDRLYL